MPNPWLNEHKSMDAMNYFLNDIYKLLTINFKIFGSLLKKLPIRSLC
jgi:hypothetical protein